MDEAERVQEAIKAASQAWDHWAVLSEAIDVAIDELKDALEAADNAHMAATMVMAELTWAMKSVSLAKARAQKGTH